MNRVLPILTGLALICGGLASAGGTAAAAARDTLACGATITTDTTLHHDLVNCPGDGLVIMADNVTLDLNGHTIDGDGDGVQTKSCPPGKPCDTGVLKADGYDGVTITGGSVTDFGWGIYVAGGSDTVLSRLTVTGHLLAGIHIRDATDGSVVHSRILRNGLNGPDEDFAGMNLFNSNGVLIEGNDISRSADIGLFAVLGRASRNIIKGNRFADNPEAAILLDGDDNLVDQNLFLRDGGGIGFGGDRNRVISNVVLDIPPCTDGEGCGNALQVEGGLDNEISGNLVRRAPGGIAVQAYGPSLGRTLVSRNVIDSAYGDGIGVDVVDTGNPVTDTVLTRNLVTRSGDDGIDVRSPSTTLRRNGAFHNADLGIEAVAGVTDGGRNYAAGNGDARQCTHMRCRHAD